MLELTIKFPDASVEGYEVRPRGLVRCIGRYFRDRIFKGCSITLSLPETWVGEQRDA
jgi:hypothetical protein